MKTRKIKGFDINGMRAILESKYHDVYVLQAFRENNLWMLVYKA